jgi:hypothetical protein
MSAKELRKLKKKERKVARRAMLKVTPNVNISRRISKSSNSNSSQLTSLHGVPIFFLIFLLPVFSSPSPMCELISLQEGIISHSWERKNSVIDDRKTSDDQKSEVLIESLQSVGDENMDEEEEVKTMSSSDDTFFKPLQLNEHITTIMKKIKLQSTLYIIIYYYR